MTTHHREYYFNEFTKIYKNVENILSYHDDHEEKSGFDKNAFKVWKTQMK